MPLFNWPYTNLHNLNLDWIIKKIKNVETAETNTAASEEAAAGSAASAAESEANAAASETNAAASATAAGNYYNNIRENVSTLVTGWMDDHITPTTPPVDATLTIQGAAADAKKTGDEITDLKNAISYLNIAGVPNASYLEKGGWNGAEKDSYRQENRARTKRFTYASNDIGISLNENGSGRVYATYYDNSFNVTGNSGWVTNLLIKKGTIFNLILTTAPSGTLTETSVADILSLFTVWNASPVIVESPTGYINGMIDNNNNTVLFGDRIITQEYINANSQLVHFLPPSGMSVYVIGYDDDFNIKTYGVNGGWLSGNNWLDMSEYAYYRYIIRKSDNTVIDPDSVEIISHTYKPTRKSETVISIAKDGLNAENKDYAPKYPENSIISYMKALEQGFDAILVHLQFTADNIGVLFHDTNINRVARNTDGTAISGTVTINASTLEQLNSYDFGIAYGISGLKILTLEEGLQFFKNKGIRIFIEPTTALTQAQEDITVSLLVKYGMDKKCAYFSYNEGILARMKQKLPYALLYQYCRDEAQMLGYIDYAVQNIITDKNQFYFYTYNTFTVTDSTITALKNADIGLMQQYLEGAEPGTIATTGNKYTTILITQIAPASAVLESLS